MGDAALHPAPALGHQIVGPSIPLDVVERGGNHKEGIHMQFDRQDQCQKPLGSQWGRSQAGRGIPDCFRDTHGNRNRIPRSSNAGISPPLGSSQGYNTYLPSLPSTRLRDRHGLTSDTGGSHPICTKSHFDGKRQSCVTACRNRPRGREVSKALFATGYLKQQLSSKTSVIRLVETTVSQHSMWLQVHPRALGQLSRIGSHSRWRFLGCHSCIQCATGFEVEQRLW